ncbi:MAG: RNA polymerase factor sigma-54 [Proteobacteria bacterium]|nr:RNA polymerase factor sigma-54 [Pseudomonadota bacterium]
MSPRLQQAIKLLQMSSLDLNSYVQEQLTENPLLMEDDEPLKNEEHDSLIFNVKNTQINGDVFDILRQPITLKDHILEQILPKVKNPIERLLVNILIDELDENGYFKADLRFISKRLKIDENIVLDLFLKLQECEPAGLFARSLSECFKLQLKDQGILDEKTDLFINNLDLLTEVGLKGLCRKINISENEGQEILNFLKRLDPKPGLAFSHTDLSPLICDVKVFKDSKLNDWIVELNQESLPHIFLNTNYYQELQSKCKKGEEIVYLKSKKTHANWLLLALEQRSVNIIKVAREIVSAQSAFFEKGILFLSPLTLKDVALKTGLHESTVSRLTTNKYMLTPYGTLDFKFFFNSKLKTNSRFKEDEKELSSKQVMESLKKMIQTEDKKHPLSDDDLSILLKQEGINIARRTISKYRTILKIGSSSDRRCR